jgi:hypothetical protein
VSRWFRHYAGMMRDDKLVSVAIRAKQPVERVVWIWGAILESAAEIDDDGRFNLDAAEVAYFLRADEADISLVLDALVGMGRISENRVVKWGDRQFVSDRSADRQAKHRERKRAAAINGNEDQTSGDGGVTAASRHGDAPETDTEAETKTDTASLRSAERAKRAQRLSADWTLPDGWGKDAIDAGLPADLIDLEAAKMRDWSLSAPNGASKDWRARWRNWCREAANRLPRARAGPQPRPNPLSDAFGAMRPTPDDRPSETVSGPVRYLPAASG